MLRRRFFQWILSSSVFLPRWTRAQAAGLDPADSPLLREVALVVLPASLTPGRVTEISAQFQQWIRDYRAGADAGYGYGHPKPRVLGPNPSAHYSEQLHELNAAAVQKRVPFAQLGDSDKRDLIKVALTKAGVDSLPSQPNGRHLAADLMSFFYNSSVGEDFLYNAAIKREDCRGLASSGKRPAPLS